MKMKYIFDLEYDLNIITLYQVLIEVMYPSDLQPIITTVPSKYFNVLCEIAPLSSKKEVLVVKASLNSITLEVVVSKSWLIVGSVND